MDRRHFIKSIGIGLAFGYPVLTAAASTNESIKFGNGIRSIGAFPVKEHNPEQWAEWFSYHEGEVWDSEHGWMRSTWITSDGNVGLGVTSPPHELLVI
jgi:hypothetical protein